MGKILQSDNTYLNGKVIGATGSGDSYRNYLVNVNDILWDQENQLAIRVGHWGNFRMSEVPTFKAASPAHFFKYGTGLKESDSKAAIVNKAHVYQLYVTNLSPKNVGGQATAEFYNAAGKKLHTIQKDIQLQVGKNALDFAYQSPIPLVKIVYTISLPAYGFTTTWNGVFGYQNLVYRKVTPVVAYKAPQQYHPTNLNQQQVTGWLGEKLTANIQQRLRKADEDAMLAGFINRPGSHSWIGEHIGKFLEAACNAYDNSGDPALKSQLDRSAQQLIAAQLPDGYLGTYEMDSHWTSWDVWSHRYDMMGLLRYYELSGFQPALNASEKIGELIMKTFGSEAGQRDIVKAGGHVGMAATCILESMAELYRFSGNKKYLDYCDYLVNSFNHPGGPHILQTLNELGRVDKVANAKAYEMMSNLLGVIKLYRLTNDVRFLTPVLTAWRDIAQKRLYITGTTSSFEHFQDDQELPATAKDNMGEGCVTTTWVQLNYQLLCVTGEMKYLDELERSVYNHLTGAENPQTGCVSYYTPLVGKKPYGCSITCCMSSVPRAIALAPLFVNGKINNRPTFLFYQPGTYATTVNNDQQVAFSTVTNFPADGRVSINVDKTTVTPFTLDFRRPYWAGDFSIAINGKKQSVSGTETVSIIRKWNKGDKVTIQFTLPTIVLDGGKSYPGFVALQRGPQVLAVDKNINQFSTDKIAIDTGHTELQFQPSVLPAKWIGGLAFNIKAMENNVQKNLVLVPYADASQTGGEITTWIKQTEKNE